MAGPPQDCSPADICRQLERMLQSREIATQPRIARMLRFLVEESVRNGFEPISQRLFASHALGLPDNFNPTLSAAVRVNMARLRRAVENYFTRHGGVDPLAFEITPGPYRLVVTKASHAGNVEAARSAVDARRRRPLLLLVEPRLSGDQPGLAREIALKVASQLLESSLVSISPPLPRERLAKQSLSLAEFAATFGYEFTVDSELGLTAGEWIARLVITDALLGEPVDDATHGFGRFPDLAAAAAAIATWICHRIGDCFATRVSLGAAS
jgi:hypothetical protein